MIIIDHMLQAFLAFGGTALAPLTARQNLNPAGQ
jgi:hypothetical protein